MSTQAKQRSGGRRPDVQAAHRRKQGTGNARQNYERYLARAREAQVAGDEVEMERCFQYAEHYFRIMRAAGGA